MENIIHDRVGKEVDFVQLGRIARFWSEKSGCYVRVSLPDRPVRGVITAVSRGKRSFQIVVKTPVGESLTAHIPYWP